MLRAEDFCRYVSWNTRYTFIYCFHQGCGNKGNRCNRFEHTKIAFCYRHKLSLFRSFYPILGLIIQERWPRLFHFCQVWHLNIDFFEVTFFLLIFMLNVFMFRRKIVLQKIPIHLLIGFDNIMLATCLLLLTFNTRKISNFFYSSSFIIFAYK